MIPYTADDDMLTVESKFTNTTTDTVDTSDLKTLHDGMMSETMDGLNATLKIGKNYICITIC